MSTIEDTLIQSPLVAIFWTTHIPFLIVVLCLVGRSALSRAKSLSKRDWRVDAEPPQFGYPERAQHFRNERSASRTNPHGGRAAASQRTREGASRPHSDPPSV